MKTLPKCRRKNCGNLCEVYSPNNTSVQCTKHNEEDGIKRRARMQRLRQRRVAAGLPPNQAHTCHLPTALRKDHPVNMAIHTLSEYFGLPLDSFTKFLEQNSHNLP